MSQPLKTNLYINGVPAPKDLIDKGLFDTHIKIGHTYRTGQNTVQVVKKTWEEVTPGEYNVRLENILVQDLPDNTDRLVPATQVLEHLAIGEAIGRIGHPEVRISHIHWWLKPDSTDADVSVYIDPLVIVAKH